VIFRSVVIDCFPESVRKYSKDFAIVAVDVIRATTSAVTAVAKGRRCFFVTSVAEAFETAKRLKNPLLIGEVAGQMPDGFDLTNSPAKIFAHADVQKPMIILSSSGTHLLSAMKDFKYGYVASLRNYRSTIDILAKKHDRVAVIGAGSRGEFREEDQFCCALIAGGLVAAGFEPLDERTTRIVDRWKEEPVESCLVGASVEYLLKTGQENDLKFIREHVDDLDSVFLISRDEIVKVRC
jgi:2-phosphosulfolactate phosphatase